jgi:hypothetical protein
VGNNVGDRRLKDLLAGAPVRYRAGTPCALQFDTRASAKRAVAKHAAGSD